MSGTGTKKDRKLYQLSTMLHTSVVITTKLLIGPKHTAIPVDRWYISGRIDLAVEY